jgi:hypothetical protein
MSDTLKRYSPNPSHVHPRCASSTRPHPTGLRRCSWVCVRGAGSRELRCTARSFCEGFWEETPATNSMPSPIINEPPPQKREPKCPTYYPSPHILTRSIFARPAHRIWACLCNLVRSGLVTRHRLHRIVTDSSTRPAYNPFICRGGRYDPPEFRYTSATDATSWLKWAIDPGRPTCRITRFQTWAYFSQLFNSTQYSSIEQQHADPHPAAEETSKPGTWAASVPQG